MMLEHKDGSVSLYGMRFVPYCRTKMKAMGGERVLLPVPGVYALPGGGMAAKHDLPEIARRLYDWMEGRPWM